jgi:hypothetical protein
MPFASSAEPVNSLHQPSLMSVPGDRNPTIRLKTLRISKQRRMNSTRVYFFEECRLDMKYALKNKPGSIK